MFAQFDILYLYLEYEASDTVRTIKEKIAAKDLKNKYEADAIELRYQKKILDDSKTIESYEIEEDGFVLVVKQQPVKVPAASAAPTNTQNNTATSVTSTSTRSDAVTSASSSGLPMHVAQPTSSMTSQQPAASSTQSQRPTLTAPKESTVQSLEDFCDRTIGELAAHMPKGFVSLATSDYDECATQRSITGDIPTSSESGQTLTCSESSTGRRQPGEAEDLSEPSQNPQFPAFRQLIQTLRQSIQQNPALRQIFMEKLQSIRPDLYQLVQQRPQDFPLLNQVNEGGDGGDALQGGAEGGAMPGQGPPVTVTSTFSPQDQQAINRLQNMGFEHNRVIEAFLACDRSEQLAEDYLRGNFN